MENSIKIKSAVTFAFKLACRAALALAITGGLYLIAQSVV